MVHLSKKHARRGSHVPRPGTSWEWIAAWWVCNRCGLTATMFYQVRVVLLGSLSYRCYVLMFRGRLTETSNLNTKEGMHHHMNKNGRGVENCWDRSVAARWGPIHLSSGSMWGLSRDKIHIPIGMCCWWRNVSHKYTYMCVGVIVWSKKFFPVLLVCPICSLYIRWFASCCKQEQINKQLWN